MLILSDVDRTLIDPGKIEGENCRRLFREFAANALPYGFATARSLPSLRAVMPFSVPRALLTICSDGALSFLKGSDGTLAVRRRALLPAAARAIRLIVESRPANSSLFVFLDDRADMSVHVSLERSHETVLGSVTQGRPLTMLLPEDLANRGVLSIGCLASSDACERLSDVLEGALGETRIRVYEEVRSMDLDLWWCEVTSMHADKGSAWLAMKKQLTVREYASEQIVVLGDSDNDADLAALADHVLVPRWASRRMLDIATAIFDVEDCEQFAFAAGAHLLDWK